jgi:hypothetical protein
LAFPYTRFAIFDRLSPLATVYVSFCTLGCVGLGGGAVDEAPLCTLEKSGFLGVVATYDFLLLGGDRGTRVRYAAARAERSRLLDTRVAERSRNVSQNPKELRAGNVSARSTA